MKKPILCLDMDGCIHGYSQGWADGSLYDDVVPGFFEWAEGAASLFRLVIYSSRSSTPEGIAAMVTWLGEQFERVTRMAHLDGRPAPMLAEFEFASTKPPAFATIDDRAIRFNGDWGDEFLVPARIRRMKTWIEKPYNHS